MISVQASLQMIRNCGMILSWAAHLMASKYSVSLLWIFHHKFKINSQRIQKGTLMHILPWERHITEELVLSSLTANPMFSNKLLRRWSFSAYFSLWHRDLSSVYITIMLFVLLCVSKLGYLVLISTPWKHSFCLRWQDSWKGGLFFPLT